MVHYNSWMGTHHSEVSKPKLKKRKLTKHQKSVQDSCCILTVSRDFFIITLKVHCSLARFLLPESCLSTMVVFRDSMGGRGRAGAWQGRWQGRGRAGQVAGYRRASWGRAGEDRGVGKCPVQLESAQPAWTEVRSCKMVLNKEVWLQFTDRFDQMYLKLVLSRISEAFTSSGSQPSHLTVIARFSAHTLLQSTNILSQIDLIMDNNKLFMKDIADTFQNKLYSCEMTKSRIFICTNLFAIMVYWWPFCTKTKRRQTKNLSQQEVSERLTCQVLQAELAKAGVAIPSVIEEDCESVAIFIQFRSADDPQVLQRQVVKLVQGH